MDFRVADNPPALRRNRARNPNGKAGVSINGV